MKFSRATFWALVILIPFSFGFITSVTDNFFEISKNLDIFGHLYREINSTYVEDTDPEQLMRTGIDAMLQSLDPYTNFISEGEAEDLRFLSTGQYAGVGAVVGRQGDRILIMEPYRGYPADEAGLQAGDEIVGIDGKPVSGADMEVGEVRDRLRGKVGTDLSLTIRQADGTLREVALTRARIKVDNVPYYGMVDEHVGYVKLTGFTQDAGQELEKAIRDLRQEQPDLQGLVLDLRNNPGGRLDEAVRIANTFIPQGEVIVETHGRMDASHRVHRAQRAAVEETLPLVVLINQGSASASEIVAGAIQDLDRGVIVGRRSFGKGLVQNIRPLIYNTQVKVTTAKYYTPSGRCIQAINYAERHRDGSVHRIPDSLRTSFLTRNGRTVFDGGGIEPDVEVAVPEWPAAVEALDVKGLIFDFATRFVNSHPQPADARTFALAEEDYEAFLAFVASKPFSYETQADRELQELKKTVAEEAYSDLLTEELTALEAQLAREKSQDLNRHKELIVRLLEREIARRYFYMPGEIQADFDEDPELNEALRLLRSPERYREILAGR
ncbi:MAG: S41 family peptidase [Bacteroidetes bacterium]|nr:MAG: S41 family peptidase [Bacteroidota bacterium]